MAIQQDGKRGRPIEWEKLFDKYNRKVNYWSRTYKTTPIDRIEYLDDFREKITTARERYGLNSEQAVRMLGQHAGLGTSLKKIKAYIAAVSKIAAAANLDIAVDRKAAARAFVGGVIRSEEDIEKNIKKSLGEGWTQNDLAAAVVTGTITLSEASTVLRLKYGMSEFEDRAHWISQNIFGSK